MNHFKVYPRTFPDSWFFAWVSKCWEEEATMEEESQLYQNARGLQEEEFVLTLRFKNLIPGLLGSWHEAALDGEVCGRANASPHLWVSREKQNEPRFQSPC